MGEKSVMRGRTATLACMALVGVLVALLLGACGGDDGDDGDDGGGSASADGGLPDSGEVVLFGLSRQNPYVAQWEEGARAQAEEYGWTLRYVETANSQQQQDGQITQLLGSPDQPIGIILSPFEGEAAAASMQAIKDAGIPLNIIDAHPPPEQEPLFDMFSGPSNEVSATTSAELLQGAAERNETQLAQGLTIGCPWDYTSCSQRRDFFQDALAEIAPDAEIVDAYPSEGFGPQEGYAVANQVVPAEEGNFDFVYALNDAIAAGVIRALTDNDITPGKDVFVAGGTCLGRTTNQMVIDGRLAGTAVQSPYINGQLSVINIAQYLNNGGEVQEGSVDVSADEPPSIDEAPYKYNYLPNPTVTNKSEFDSVTVWGETARELCGYTE